MVDVFHTPEWRERLQLVLHLLNSTARVPYVQGPAGAGKTSFGRSLRDALDSGTDSSWLSATADTDLQQAAAVLNEGVTYELGDSLELLPGPVLLVDDAHRLPQATIELLPKIRATGVRLVLFGEPVSDWDGANLPLQFVDLPPLSEAQLPGLLAHLGYPSVNDGDLAQLHRASGGYPGRLLEVLEQRHQATEPVADTPSAQAAPLRAVRWGLGLVGLTVLALLLIRSDWFGDAEPDTDTATGTEAADAATRVAAAVETPAAIPPTIPQAVTGEAEPAGSTGESEQSLTADDAMAAAEGWGYDAWAMAPVPPDQRPFRTLRFAVRGAAAAADPSQSPPGRSGDATQPAATKRDTATDQPGKLDAAPTAAASVAALPAPAAAPRAGTTTQQTRPQRGDSARAAGPPPPAAAQANAKRPLEATAQQAPRAAAQGYGIGWLKQRPAAHYTLQLVAARERGAIEKFVEKHRLSGEYAVFERDLDGKPWYSLVAGEFPDRDRALAAKGRLAPALRDQAWPRSFASIFAQLAPAR